MSIKVRLLLSNLAMFVGTLIIFTVICYLAGDFFYNYPQGKEVHGTVALQLSVYDNNRKNLTRIITEIMKQPPPDDSPAYYRKFDSELSSTPNPAGMVVFNSNNRLIHISKILNHPAILKLLTNGTGIEERIDINKKIYTVRQYLIKFANRSFGRIYFLSDITTISKKINLILVGLIFLISLSLSNAVLTFLVSKSILKPLTTLQKATEKVKAGDLNFSLRPTSKDELGQLTAAFEEMRARLKESLETQIRYDSNRKELITAISHDLKTPVTSIKGYVEGIIDGVANSPQKRERYLKTIYAKANRLNRLIDELFLFSKLDLKKVPFQFEKIELIQYFRDCIAEYRFEAETQATELIYTSSSSQSSLWAIADRDQLHRVIVNILENSLKYSRPDQAGKITLDITANHEWITVRVEDNGQGVKPEDLPYIFDRFYRADPGRNSSIGGSGLGLAISKLIIEGHGGRIWAESQYGKGTTIIFNLKRYGETG